MIPTRVFSPPWWWRMLGSLARLPARAAMRGRFGPWPFAGHPTIWLHAASLGETKGLLRLADALDGLPLTLTATTASGLSRLRDERPDLESFLLPWDDASTVDGFLRARRVERAIFLESDAWPTAFSRMARLGIPVAMAAVRCSNRSRTRWIRLRRIIPGMTESVCIAWADGDASALDGCGFRDARSGASLKWAGVSPAPVTAIPGRYAALSFHLRDLPRLARLARNHPGSAWLWFPRRVHLVPVCRLLARTIGLRPVPDGASPAAGEVWIAPRTGLVRTRLPGCEAAWVSPGHDREEPSRLGVGRLLGSEPEPPGMSTSPESTRDAVVAWIRTRIHTESAANEASE